MARKYFRIGLVYGFNILCIVITAGFLCTVSAQEPGGSTPGKLFDPFISGQQVLSWTEFEKSILDSAAEAAIPQDSVSAILQDFNTAYANRIVRPQEWRYSILALLYRNGVPYDNASRFLMKLRFSPVDMGFLDHIRELAAVSGSGVSGNPPFVAGTNGVNAPVVLNQPLPSYTPEARQARAEGIVLLKAVICKDGSVTNPVVLRGLGYGLDESAIETILRRWRFSPGTRDGVPVDVQANIEVFFKLY